MDIGKMNKRITFLRYVERKDDVGMTTQVLDEVKTVWGSLYPVRGAEFYEAQKVQSKITHKCYVRWMRGIDSNCLLRCGGVTYMIDSVIDAGLGHRMLEILCYEYVNREEAAYE